jgi:hypothetical protein
MLRAYMSLGLASGAPFLTPSQSHDSSDVPTLTARPAGEAAPVAPVASATLTGRSVVYMPVRRRLTAAARSAHRALLQDVDGGDSGPGGEKDDCIWPLCCKRASRLSAMS